MWKHVGSTLNLETSSNTAKEGIAGLDPGLIRSPSVMPKPRGCLTEIPIPFLYSNPPKEWEFTPIWANCSIFARGLQSRTPMLSTSSWIHSPNQKFQPASADHSSHHKSPLHFLCDGRPQPAAAKVPQLQTAAGQTLTSIFSWTGTLFWRVLTTEPGSLGYHFLGAQSFVATGIITYIYIYIYNDTWFLQICKTYVRSPAPDSQINLSTTS